ncbi:hypothetical protein SNEBB_003305 [Seison nebaliae]|nr:hypothetical protein SNEBB_003305 [Seison nebaliae]
MFMKCWSTIWVVCILFASINCDDFDDDNFISCVGFIRSSDGTIKIPYETLKVQLKLLNGEVRTEVNVAPNNGDYMIPIYEKIKRKYILEVVAPRGWSFKQKSYQIEIDGKTDKCSKGENIDFEFVGFGLSGLINGVKNINNDIRIKLFRWNDNVLIEEMKLTDGNEYTFNNILPNQYYVTFSSDFYHLKKKNISVTISKNNWKADPNEIIGIGFNLKIRCDIKWNFQFNLIVHSLTKEECLSNDGKFGDDKKCKKSFNCENDSNVWKLKKYSINKKLSYSIENVHSTILEMKSNIIHLTELNQNMIIDMKLNEMNFHLKLHYLVMDEMIIEHSDILVNKQVKTKTDVSGHVNLSQLKFNDIIELSNENFIFRKIELNQVELEKIISMKDKSSFSVRASGIKICSMIKWKPNSINNRLIQGNDLQLKLLKKKKLLNEINMKKGRTDNYYENCLIIGVKVLNENLEIILKTKNSDDLSFYLSPSNYIINKETIGNYLKNKKIFQFYQIEHSIKLQMNCLSKCGNEKLKLMNNEKEIIPMKSIKKSEKLIDYRIDNLLPGIYSLETSEMNKAICWEIKKEYESINLLKYQKNMELELSPIKEKGFTLQLLSKLSGMKIIVKKMNEEKERKEEIIDNFELEQNKKKFHCIYSTKPVIVEIENNYSNHLIQEKWIIDEKFDEEIIIDIDEYYAEFSLKLQLSDNLIKNKGLTSNKLFNMINDNDLITTKLNGKLIRPTNKRQTEKNTIFMIYSIYSKESILNELIVYSNNFILPGKSPDEYVKSFKLNINQIEQFFIELFPMTIIRLESDPIIMDLKGKVQLVREKKKREIKLITSFPSSGIMEWKEIVEKNDEIHVNVYHKNYLFELTKCSNEKLPKSGDYLFYNLYCEKIIGFKRSGIIITLLYEDKHPISGVTVNLVADDEKRRNEKSDNSGIVSFSDLTVQSYFMRVLLREHDFEPSSKLIKLNSEGEQITLTIIGKRTAFSLSGHVISVLNNQTSPNEKVRCQLIECDITNERLKKLLDISTIYDENVIGQQQQFDVTSENGNFRFRSLLPNCLYEIQRLLNNQPTGLKQRHLISNEDIEQIPLLIGRRYLPSDDDDENNKLELSISFLMKDDVLGQKLLPKHLLLQCIIKLYDGNDNRLILTESLSTSWILLQVNRQYLKKKLLVKLEILSHQTTIDDSVQMDSSRNYLTMMIDEHPIIDEMIQSEKISTGIMLDILSLQSFVTVLVVTVLLILPHIVYKKFLWRRR